MNASSNDGTRYDERFTLPVPGGRDHIEVLAQLVTEIAHFERAARTALRTAIVEDKPPAAGGLGILTGQQLPNVASSD
jgi:hypothetical protein